MEWIYTVTIDLGFDCTPPGGNGDTSWDVASSAVDRIHTFLENEPPGSTSSERFTSQDARLYMRVDIPVATLAEAGRLYNLLVSSLDSFPPLLEDLLPRYSFVAQGTPDPEEPDED